jgi:hypothetical protein
MAFCMEVFKSGQEDECFIYYTYQFSIAGDEYKSASGKIRHKLRVVSGRLKIDKRNGDIHTVELAENDNGIHAERAGWTLMKYWKSGEYPDKTLWASF